MSGIIPASFQRIIDDLDWYHPNADRHIAESLLMQNGIDGSYILRNSKQEKQLAVSVRCKDSVKHFPLSFDGEVIRFGLASFNEPEEFVNHFQQQPFIGGESGVITWLKHPYPRTVEEPDIYDKVKIHAQYKEKSVTNKKHQELAICSKEGFLTKMGGFVKNWKVRWFVLKKGELRYYKCSTDTDPIKILDLHECTDCGVDTTLNRPNCFKIVFPWRTFYFATESENDRTEWMDRISWTMRQLKPSGSL